MDATSETSLRVREFLLALFADLVSDKNWQNCFKAAHRELHRFFWELAQDEDRKAFVAELLFDTNGNFPHSEQIDELLQEFQLSGVLSRPNPTYRYNDIAIASSPVGEEFKERLSPEQRKAYEEALDSFKNRLGVPDKE